MRACESVYMMNVCFSNLKIDDKPVLDQVISLCEELNVTVTENDLVDHFGCVY